MAVTLIAEVSSNAGGSVARAIQFIDAFAAAGATWIKFQWTRAARLALTDPQRQWFQRAEWAADVGPVLAQAGRAAGVGVLWTVYHPDDVPLVAQDRAIKVGSGEAHQENLARAVLATAAAQIYVTEGLLPAHALYQHDPRVILLGGCARYPAPHGLVGARFPGGRYQGWSDHSLGLEEAHLAVVLGATVIERHVQLPTQARPPQPWESTVEEFRELRRRVDEDPRRFLNRWTRDPQLASPRDSDGLLPSFP